MIILGISAYYHDSSAALVVDGKIVAAAVEERFTRIKHDNRFPINACRFCMENQRITLEQVDEVVFYEKPFVKFERILRTHIQYAPKSFGMFLKTMPIWLKERFNMRATIQKELKKHFNVKKERISFVDHHISHAANAFYQSGFEESAVVVVDAVGEESTTSIYKADKSGIQLLESQLFPHSLGLLYSAVTYFLGFKVNSDEYKVMGLAPYGNPAATETKRFIDIISKNLSLTTREGELQLNDKWFAFMYSDHMVCDKVWQKLFGISKRTPADSITQSHKNLAFAIQKVYEDVLLKIVERAKAITGSSHLCISGGCAMNCSANGILLHWNMFEDLYVPYAPDDSGCSIGAALAVSHIKYGIERQENDCTYLGPEFSNSQILEALKGSLFKYRLLSDDELNERISSELAGGKIVGWFQGKMEFGARALGNRSILADPRNPVVREIVNSKVKFRESFRPFAPVVLKELASDIFDIDSKYGKHMSYTCRVKSGKYPGVTHVDKTARVQVLDRTDNQRLYNLLMAFKERTGCPLLLNTSFNIMGEPIVCTTEDALDTFNKSGIDILVMGNYLIEK